MSKKKKILICTAGGVFVLFFILIGSQILGHFIKVYAMSHKTLTDNEADDELMALIKEAEPEPLSTQNPDADTEDESAAPVELDEKLLTDLPVRLSDIYSSSGSTAIFKCFDVDAESYEWEYYDVSAKEWKTAEPSRIQSSRDELNRMVSSLQVEANQDRHGFMVRCTLHFKGKEDETQTACLFILKDKVKEIQTDDFVAAANTYVSAQELPVRITYLDGSQEEITGLNDFYFLTSEEEKDYSTSVSGNRIETTTLIKTECVYFYADQDVEQAPVMRYRAGESDEIETTCKIIGKDLLPPVISDVTISPYEVSNIDQPMTVSVTIFAEDDLTPYPELEYAFVLAGEEPKEEEWIKKPAFDVCIERNGIYIAYARDGAGNTSQTEKEIITVDTKAPVIQSVSLAAASGWCRSNTIMVEAQDAGAISFCFENKSEGITSDWITFSEYSVDRNGTWLVRARDEAGNISETEILVSNIDREAPVILGISIK